MSDDHGAKESGGKQSLGGKLSASKGGKGGKSVAGKGGKGTIFKFYKHFLFLHSVVSAEYDFN